jgi:hypothetical protein
MIFVMFLRRGYLCVCIVGAILRGVLGSFFISGILVHFLRVIKNSVYTPLFTGGLGGGVFVRIEFIGL